MKESTLSCLLVLLFAAVVVGATNVFHANLLSDDRNRLFGSMDGKPPTPEFPASIGGGIVRDQVNVVGEMQSRLGTMFTAMGNACCSHKSQCSNSGNYCTRSCPANCWVTGWSTAPTMDIKSFSIDSDQPASYTPTLIVPQNYTNFSKKQNTTATFNYLQSFTDTVTVTNSQTLTVSESIKESLNIKISSTTVTVGFSYSTTETTSVTNSTTKQWGITFGPTTVPECSGLYVECYILTANFNPTFTAVYEVDGTPTDECSGNWYWNTWPLSEYAEYSNLCIDCDPTLCPSPSINFDNTITVTGTWNGIFGAEVLCTDKPYPLPPDQCSD